MWQAEYPELLLEREQVLAKLGHERAVHMGMNYANYSIDFTMCIALLHVQYSGMTACTTVITDRTLLRHG